MKPQQEYIYGTLSVPKLLDISGSRYRVCLFITRDYIVIVDDSELSSRIFSKIRQRRIHQGENKARFLFNYLAEIIDRDYEMLDTMEQRLMEMEGGKGWTGRRRKFPGKADAGPQGAFNPAQLL